MMYAVYKNKPEEIIQFDTAEALESSAFCFSKKADAEKFARVLIDKDISLLESRLACANGKTIKHRKGK